MTAEQRRALRAKAHHLHPVVAVGTHGLTPTVLHEIDIALKAHELIKIRVFSDVRSERDALLARICGELECAPVQHLGKLLIVWRHNPDLHRKTGDDSKPGRTRVVRRPPVRPLIWRALSNGSSRSFANVDWWLSFLISWRQSTI